MTQSANTGMRPKASMSTTSMKEQTTTGTFASYKTNTPSPLDVRKAWLESHPAPGYLNLEALQHLLDHDNHAMRESLRDFLKDDLFKPRYGLPLEKERELALARLKLLCPPEVKGGRFLSVRDFLTDPRRIFAAHEIIGLADGSLATKLTVQFNLAGGTILKLGTERHHRLIEKMDSIERVGCFALTGKNVPSMFFFVLNFDHLLQHTPSYIRRQND